jgi:hypothetical protein
MSKQIIGGQEFSTSCPDNCPGKDELVGQGGLCHRCPIFNCEPVEVQPYEMGPEQKEACCFRLLEPDDYREDWALVWKQWFDGGMVGYPHLKF